MKSFITVILAAALSAAVVNSSALPAPAALPAELQPRFTCKSPSKCSWFNSGQCEYWCGGSKKFTRMQGCGWGRKRCCCTT